MIKKHLVIKILSGIIILITSSSLMSCASKVEENVENHKIAASSSTASKDTTLYIIPGKKEVEGMKAMMKTESFKKIHVWADQVKKAGAYEDAKNYETAEMEYKKAIELSPSEADQGVPRSGLLRIYEVTHQYNSAIEQIDWLLAQGLRKDVTDKLLAQKQTLEKLLAEQTQSGS